MNYNIFENPFYDTKPAPKWAFTVEFMLSEDMNVKVKEKELPNDPPEWLNNLYKFLNSGKPFDKEEWMDKLSKAVEKVPVKHPQADDTIMLYFPAYALTFNSRYNQSGELPVTFNDNRKREIRYILEQLQHAKGFNYQNDPGDDSVRPTLPSCFYFDMLVRIYDVDRVAQYDPTKGPDEVAEKGTVMSFLYENCYVSKIGQEDNTYESKEETRKVEATIVYNGIKPLD